MVESRRSDPLGIELPKVDGRDLRELTRCCLRRPAAIGQ